MKAHKYWSLGALAAMIGTFYTGYKNNIRNGTSYIRSSFRNLWLIILASMYILSMICMLV